MTKFGDGLRRLRRESHDPKNGKGLSQKRFGELLNDECGRYFSGTAVHYWESGESEIHKDDRELLMGILKVLHKTGGLKSMPQAASLLRAGNFRALDKNEKQQVFPKDLLESSTPPSVREVPNQTLPVEPIAKKASFAFSFQKLIEEASEGPPPVWPRVAAAIMRKISDWVEAANPVRALTRLPLWILAYSLLTPALQWPYPSQQTAIDYAYMYISASYILPLLIGLLTNTDKNPVWKERESVSPATIRLYTYQGAFIGFHVGYFSVFIIYLIAFYLQIRFFTWFQFMLAGFPLFMGTMGAHVVPNNLWLAYKRLWFSDGWIFFVFIPLGPIWAWFFLEYYSWLISRGLGALIIVTALILAACWSRYKTGKV